MARSSGYGATGAERRLPLVGVLGFIAIALAGCAPVGTTPTADSADRPAIRDVMAALMRSGVGPDQIAVELTYASPLFFEVTGLRPPPEMSSRPTLAFMLQETVHDGSLPSEPPAVLMVLESGVRAGPYDVTVTATDPHHRTTRLLFPDVVAGTAAARVPGSELNIKLVVPFADGTVSAGNTFEWQLPIDLGTTRRHESPGA